MNKKNWTETTRPGDVLLHYSLPRRFCMYWERGVLILSFSWENHLAMYRVRTQNIPTLIFAPRYSAAETAELNFGLKYLPWMYFEAMTKFWPQPQNGLYWRPSWNIFGIGQKWQYLWYPFEFSNEFFCHDLPPMGRLCAAGLLKRRRRRKILCCTCFVPKTCLTA